MSGGVREGQQARYPDGLDRQSGLIYGADDVSGSCEGGCRGACLRVLAGVVCGVVGAGKVTAVMMSCDGRGDFREAAGPEAAIPHYRRAPARRTASPPRPLAPRVRRPELAGGRLFPTSSRPRPVRCASCFLSHSLPPSSSLPAPTLGTEIILIASDPTTR